MNNKSKTDENTPETPVLSATATTAMTGPHNGTSSRLPSESSTEGTSAQGSLTGPQGAQTLAMTAMMGPQNGTSSSSVSDAPNGTSVHGNPMGPQGPSAMGTTAMTGPHNGTSSSPVSSGPNGNSKKQPHGNKKAQKWSNVKNLTARAQKKVPELRKQEHGGTAGTPGRRNPTLLDFLLPGSRNSLQEETRQEAEPNSAVASTSAAAQRTVGAPAGGDTTAEQKTSRYQNGWQKRLKRRLSGTAVSVQDTKQSRLTGTPKAAERAPVRAVTSGLTYSQAAKATDPSLEVCISRIDKTDVGESESAHMKKQLTKAVMDAEDDAPVRVNATFLRAGAVWCLCADAPTAAWVKENAPGIPGFGEGHQGYLARLKSEMPKTLKLHFFVDRETVSDPEKALRKLFAQNGIPSPTVGTVLMYAPHKDPEDPRRTTNILMFEVDEGTGKKMKSLNHRLHFGIGRVTIHTGFRQKPRKPLRETSGKEPVANRGENLGKQPINRTVVGSSSDESDNPDVATEENCAQNMLPDGLTDSEPEASAAEFEDAITSPARSDSTLVGNAMAVDTDAHGEDA